MNARRWIAAVVVACAMPCVHAETLYVIEQLVVSVNAAPDGSGDRVGQIKSGDRVEALERQGDQTHVQLASGQQGWVRTSYLSMDPPLRQQLATRTEELDKVRKEKAQLETDLAAARAAAASAAKAVTNRDAAASSAPTTSVPAATRAPQIPASVADQGTASSAASESASQAAPPLFEDKPMMPSRPSWLLASLSALLALVIGFGLGWRVLDRRIRAKYGGLRIY